MKNRLSKKIYRTKTIMKINKKIELLGINCKYDTFSFLNKRLLCTIIMFIIISLLTLGNFFVAIVGSILTYFLIEYLFLDLKIKKRISKLENEALYFFEILTLCLESSTNIKKALIITTDNISNELSWEFKKALNEVNIGKTLSESLNDLQNRIPSQMIKNVIININQSETFGNKIVDALKSQIKYLRKNKILDIKANITKIPIKISVISVLFFVPIMLLLILSPVILNMLN